MSSSEATAWSGASAAGLSPARSASLTARTEIAGRVVAASKDDPRYLVRSEKSGKETTRRPQALKRVD
jgi:hypothetical protein